MADRAISALPTATSLTASDLFVLSQGNQAKNTTWQTIIGYLATALDGHGGISSIAKTGSSGLVDTYTVTFADNTTTTFTVTNGKSISSITQKFAVSSSNTTAPSTWYDTLQTMTTTNRYLWSYMAVTYNDSTTSSTTPSVIGVYGDTGEAWYVWVRYSGVEPTADTDVGIVPDEWIGIYSGTESDPSNLHYTDYVWYEYKGEKGDTGSPATITTQSVSYQASNSGTVAPSGSWTTTVPTVTAGNYLWTRTQLQFNTGNLMTAYSVSRFGIDGAGAVSTVNSISPDGNGNVELDAGDIPMSDSLSVQSHVDDIEDTLTGKTHFILASTGDTTDRWSDISDMLTTYGACVLGDGVFYIDSTIDMPEGSSLSGLGMGTILQLKDSSSEDVAINVNSYCSVENMTINGHSTDLPYSGYTQGTRFGVELIGDAVSFEDLGTYTHNYAKLSNLTIKNFDGGGILANRNDGMASFLATNIDILKCCIGIDIKLFSEFHSFSNVRSKWCNTGCRMQGGNNLFHGCHFSTNLTGLVIDNSNDDLVNDSHSSFVGCSFAHAGDNTGNLVWIRGIYNGIVFSGCNFWHGSIDIRDSKGIVFTGNLLGIPNNVFIISNNTGCIVANNQFLNTLPTFNTGTGYVAWENNIDGSGNPIIITNSLCSFNTSQAQYLKKGTIQITTEVPAVCVNAGKYTVSISYPFVATGSYSITVNNMVLLGVGTVSNPGTATKNDNYARYEFTNADASSVGKVRVAQVTYSITGELGA